MTSATNTPNLNQIATDFQNGIRRLVSIAASDLATQNLAPVERLRQSMAECDNDIGEVRLRSASILAVKDELDCLQKEANERRREAKAADQALIAQAQQVGDATFRYVLEGQVIDLPEVLQRKELHDQIEILKREKEELGKTSAVGFTDNAKALARQTTLSGRIYILQQKVASADKALGNAVLRAETETKLLSQKSAPLLLQQLANARNSIAACAEAIAAAEKRIKERQAKAIAYLGIKACDTTILDAEYQRCADRIFEIESRRIKARWDCGEAIMSLTPDDLPVSITRVSANLKRLKAEHSDACKMPSVDKRVITADLREQVELLYERIGDEVYEKGVFKNKLSEEFGVVASAVETRRETALRRLGMAALKRRDEITVKRSEEIVVTMPALQAISIKIEAIELTIKELDGGTLIGTGGKTAPLSTGAKVGMIGCLAVCVLMCGGFLTSALNKARNDAQKSMSGTTMNEVHSERTNPDNSKPVKKSIAESLGQIAGHWGIIDSSGRLVVPCRYSDLGLWGDVSELNKGIFANPLWWKKSSLGTVPIPARSSTSVPSSNEWGFVDRKGVQRVPQRFLRVTFFTGDVAAAQSREGKWGFINSLGEWVIPARYDDAKPFSSNDLAAVRKGDKWGFISKIGNEVVACKYTTVRNFADNRASVSIGILTGGFVKGGWGVIDEKGNEIVECKHFNIGPFHSGYALLWHKDIVLNDSETGSWGIIDRNGKFTFGLQRQVLFPIRSWGAYEHEDELEYLHSTVLFGTASTENGLPEMRILTPTGGDFTDVRCQLRMGQNRGESLLPVTLPFDVHQMQRTGIADERWGKVGYLDANGKLCIPHQFVSAQPFSEGRAAASQKTAMGEKWGFIDDKGKNVVEPQFTQVRPFSEGRSAVKKGELWGYIDKHGEWIVQPRFSEATPFSGGIAFVKAP